MFLVGHIDVDVEKILKIEEVSKATLIISTKEIYYKILSSLHKFLEKKK